MKTIKSSSEISRMFDEGTRIGTPELSLLVLRSKGEHDREGRVAFIAGKKLGNAVWRNRAKRRMRALCQELGGPLPGVDVVFIARSKVTSASWTTLVEHSRAAYRKASTHSASIGRETRENQAKTMGQIEANRANPRTHPIEPEGI